MSTRTTLRRCRRLALCSVSVIALAAAAVPAARASGPAVFPPQSRPLGLSYGEWSALWWKEAVRQTGAPGTPFAAGQVDCAALGTRRVVFLVGTTTVSPVTRSCTIPVGRAILFPVINGECSQVEGNGSTDPELRACAAGQANTFTGLHASVDGTPIPGLPGFRAASPLFRFSPVDGNVFGIPQAILTKSVADGYWVMLTPLRPGTHTVAFGGTAVLPSPMPPFVTETAYTLTVR
jgi:hypothetical protein